MSLWRQRHSVFFLLAIIGSMALPSSGAAPGKITLDFFFEPGCAECEMVRTKVLPRLQGSHAGAYVLREWDTGIKTNYLRLVEWQERLSAAGNESVSMVVDGRHFLEGVGAIQDRLLPVMGQCIRARSSPDEGRAVAPVPSGGSVSLVARLGAFRLPAIALAGLIDGINPCAIGTLVFFMSLLAVSKVTGARLLLMGLSFCVASFVTYTVIGFGLLRVLHLLSGFAMIRRGIEVGMMAFLAVLAFLSFKDAYRYRKTGDAHDVSLQIPKSIKDKIHAVMRKGVKAQTLIGGGLIGGVMVTALESVCTGQVYVPTLALVAQEGGMESTRAWAYLLVYNGMFIVPLVIVFGVTFFGVRSQTLIDWSKRHVTMSKILMGVLFLALLCLTVVL